MEFLFIYFKEFDNVKNGLKTPSDSWLKTICGNLAGSLMIYFTCIIIIKDYCVILCLILEILIMAGWTVPVMPMNYGSTFKKKYVTLMIYYKLKQISRDEYDPKKVAKKRKKLTYTYFNF